MRIALAGAGAFGIRHLDALAVIDGVTVTAVVSRRPEQAAEVAARYGARHAGTDLAEVLARDDVDAVILCTPTQLHAGQAIAAMRAGKHVQVEIPLADSWARPSGSLTSRSKNALSNSLLMKPARGPCSWWLMPPVPHTCTLRSASKLATARRSALPSS